jgi:hypothetical protein
VSILGSSYGYGMNLSSASYQNVYNNSVNATTSSTSNIALYLAAGSNLNIKDNIVVCTGGGYVYYVSSPSAIASSDYNDFYGTGTNLAYWAPSNATNLAALQALSSKDANSVSKAVVFVSPQDLHLAGISIGDRSLGGTPVTEVTTDIDGDLRDALHPYMGADEAAIPLAVNDHGILPRSGVEVAPKQYQLLQNYPNPFNPETVIKFSVEQTGLTSVELYNVLGQRVATLFSGVAEAGQYYQVRLNGANLSSGVYFYRVQSGNWTDLKKMILLK